MSAVRRDDAVKRVGAVGTPDHVRVEGRGVHRVGRSLRGRTESRVLHVSGTGLQGKIVVSQNTFLRL